MKSIINKNLSLVPVWLVYLIGLSPAVILFFLAFFNLLGTDPLKTLEHELGEYALLILIFLLSFSSIRAVFGLNLNKFRRSTGLLVFWYVLLHFLTYLLLDQQLIWDLIVKDLVKRPYIIIGVFGFIALIPLALTSNKWSVRYLGFANWKRLHLLVYLAAFLAVSHYLMLVKSWPVKPLIYFLLVILLIMLRFGFKLSNKKIKA